MKLIALMGWVEEGPFSTLRGSDLEFLEAREMQKHNPQLTSWHLTQLPLPLFSQFNKCVADSSYACESMDFVSAMGTYLPKSMSSSNFVCAKSQITPNLLTWRNAVREAHTGLIRSTYTTGYNSCVEISKCWYWITEFYWSLSVRSSVRLSGIQKHRFWM